MGKVVLRRGATTLAVILGIFTLAVSAMGMSQSASAAGCPGSLLPNKGPLSARMSANGHSPRVGNWPIAIAVRYKGKGFSGANISYQALFQGRVVKCQSAPSKNLRNGLFRDTIKWPRAALNIPIVFRVVIQYRGAVRNVDWPLKVRA